MGSSPAPKKISQYGLTEVWRSSEPPLVDIVLVHGLNGDPHRTWTALQSNVFWPVDLLPELIQAQGQKIRILTYGYDAKVTAFTDGTSKDRIHNHAESLVARLVANRSLRGATERPIIFVCHSLGGLVVKRALIYSRSLSHRHTEHLRSIYVSTFGILFLGTPHNGSNVAKWGALLQSICTAVLPKKFFDSSPELIQALKSNNETLQNINLMFVDIMQRFHIYYFHESKPMDMKGTLQFVVDEDSAAPIHDGVERMGIEADHSHIVKFDDETSPGFEAVAEAILRYANDSIDRKVIETRWRQEKQARTKTRAEQAEELLGSDGTEEKEVPSIGRPQQSLPPPEADRTWGIYEVEEADSEEHVPNYRR